MCRLRSAVYSGLCERTSIAARLFTFSGHGHFDTAACDRYLAGQPGDYDYPAEAIDRALRKLPGIAG